MEAFYQWLLAKFLKSSKFWLGVVGVIAAFFSEKFGINEAELTAILTAIVSLILGKAIEDHGRNRNPNNIAPSKE